MRMRDKLITAACRTPDGIEWTSLNLKQDGPGTSQQGVLPVTVSGHTLAEALAATERPDDVAEVLQGDITVSMQTSELLMRVMEFPTADTAEIRDMVDFQIDKVSPFPADQIGLSHEILRQKETTSLVLMVAAKRSRIDAIGDAFQEKGVHIHSIDARALGWLQLLRDEGHVTDVGCQIFIIDDGIDFILIVLADGLPLAFRALHAETEERALIDELCHEIGYTLTALDAEHDVPDPAAIQFWHRAEKPAALFSQLAAKSGLAVEPHDLETLPPLSEGILRRSQAAASRIELIPREWVELQNRKQLIRKFATIAGAIAAVWLCVLLVFFSIYKARDIQLSRVQREADALAPAAQQALENRQKLKALQVYTDRSDSSLECLREITRMLPDTDIEFVSFNYKKDKGVTLRGTAGSDDLAYDFFETLTTSKLFERLKDQSVNSKVTKGVRRAIFSANLELKSEGGGR